MKIPASIVSAATCAVALSFGGLSAQAQNLLSDPGFESGGVSSAWTTFNGATFSQNFALSGSWSMENSGPGGPTVPGAFQTLATAAGDAYDLSGFGLTPNAIMTGTGGTGFGGLQITFFSGPNGTGSNLGTVETSPGNALFSNKITQGSPTDVWIPLDTGIATAPAGSQSLQVFTLVVDLSPTTVYFDNLTLTQVPEPSSFALAGLGALGLIGMLRRRK